MCYYGILFLMMLLILLFKMYLLVTPMCRHGAMCLHNLGREKGAGEGKNDSYF